MQIKLTLIFDTERQQLKIDADHKLPPIDAAALLTQAATAAIMQDRNTRGLVINPFGATVIKND